jgi:two-component system response regulator FlrC
MRLLIVGQLNGQIGNATKIAIARGAKVAHCTTIDQAVAELRDGRGADLLMVDVALSVANLSDQLRTERIHVPIVACGIGTDAGAAVEAIKGGAKEYIPLPPDAELIAAVLAAVSDDSHQLIFEDKAMRDVIALAEQVAPSEASILITGESGTGKEVLAQHVHRKSNRADRQFISVNCAAIPENLLESELFGHEKGAFTGAIARRIGKFEEADGGTLLLDEISEMDVRLQAKLLRALQERMIDRVGGAKPVKVNIRVIATSNRDLQQAVREGSFREDLLYRLNVVNLKTKGPVGLPLARQCPRTREHHPSRRTACQWPRDHGSSDPPARRLARGGRHPHHLAGSHRPRRAGSRGREPRDDWPHRGRRRARSHSPDARSLPW